MTRRTAPEARALANQCILKPNFITISIRNVGINLELLKPFHIIICLERMASPPA